MIKYGRPCIPTLEHPDSLIRIDRDPHIRRNRLKTYFLAAGVVVALGVLGLDAYLSDTLEKEADYEVEQVAQ